MWYVEVLIKTYNEGGRTFYDAINFKLNFEEMWFNQKTGKRKYCTDSCRLSKVFFIKSWEPPLYIYRPISYHGLDISFEAALKNCLLLDLCRIRTILSSGYQSYACVKIFLWFALARIF